ncbi:alpha/beta hydrolase family protein [Undibacterium rugosum]|uniref:alpha/beta hydrolase family protein n=1 Tax=Undibacterium rugosum TaxID=2762291 RepID=UPI001B80F6C1|nr:prolyl oligopeptidase family serine peptidase [Undibacterium rugosum]MBR7779581.1 prolyl oligopeptidase family serine peptidase [Undibacterium rugosum]
MRRSVLRLAMLLMTAAWIPSSYAVRPSSAAASSFAADIHESVTDIAVSVNERSGRAVTAKVLITQFKPDGDGPFPFVLLNHGRAPNRAQPPRFQLTQQARYFVQRGFAVFVPTRIGYGALGTEPDPENAGPCKAKNYASIAQAASDEILAVIAYAARLPYVDAQRLLLVGQSVGGYSTVATVARNPAGLIAAINFAGGSGGDPKTRPGEPCEADKLDQMFANFGLTSKVPMLWLYTENDQHFSAQHGRAWHAAFINAGGQAELKVLPPFGRDGHRLFSAGLDIWQPLVSQFLDEHGFPAQKK